MYDHIEVKGWQFKRKSSDRKIDAPYIEPENDDAAFVVNSGYYGYNAYQFNLDVSFQDENELIQKYRDTALIPEVDSAITDIVNESISGDEDSAPVEIILDELEQSDNIKNKIKEEFDTILELMNFNENAYEIFKKWYVDGRIYYHIILHPQVKNGIKELRYVSPLNLKKVRNEERKFGDGGIPIITSIEEFYVYMNNASQKQKTGQAIKISKDSILTSNSGLLQEEKNLIFSYIHKALKPANDLKLVENAIIIYRLSRAPERRVFYVDVGNLPKNKAEEYLTSIMRRHNNKMVYDAVTGEVKDQKNVLSMMEDFWMPRREGGRGTEVTTLQGGQNLGEIEDVEYFKKKLYMALGVPYSRMAQEAGGPFTVGRSSEITRDEIKFNKFIQRLRKKFSKIFYDALKTQLILKQIITEDEWEEFRQQITFNFISDVFFQELKDAEILRERVATLRDISEFVGTYYSKDFVQKEVLRLTEDEIEQVEKEIDEERKADPDYDMKFGNGALAMQQQGLGGGVGFANQSLPAPEAQQDTMPPAQVPSAEPATKKKKAES